MRGAKKEQDASAFLAYCAAANRPSAQTLQANNCDQDEYARKRCDVVRVEVRIEVGAQAEQQNRDGGPSEAVFAERKKKRGQCEEQRRKQEEAIEADTIHP